MSDLHSDLPNGQAGEPYPAGLKFSQSLDATNLRILILGWLDQARQAVLGGGSILQLRNAVRMVNGLTEKVSDLELSRWQVEQERQRKANNGASNAGSKRPASTKKAQNRKAPARRKVATKEA